LRQGVQGISDLITIPGIINVDFADVKTVMANSGSALMGIGRSVGEDRAIEAAKMAINSPLLEVSIDGAKGVLFNVSGGTDLAMAEINEAARIITEHIDPDAKVIFGAVLDDNLKKGEIKITVVATGFNNGHAVQPRPGVVQQRPNLFDNSPKPTPVVAHNLTTQTNGNGSVKEFVDPNAMEEDFDIPAFIRRKMR